MRSARSSRSPASSGRSAQDRTLAGGLAALAGCALLLAVFVAIVVVARQAARQQSRKLAPTAIIEAPMLDGSPGLEAIGDGGRGTAPEVAVLQPFAQPLSLPRLVERMRPGVVFLQQPTGRNQVSEGTGFLVSSGLIVTAAHVVEGEAPVVVHLYDGRRLRGEVVRRMEEADLALIRAPGGDLALSLVQAAPTPGEELVALGFPLGSALGSSPSISVSNGVLSAIRELDGMRLLQTTAPLNPGNSGGPLIIRRTGEVAGVVSLKIAETEGIAFAVSAETVRELIDTFLRD